MKRIKPASIPAPIVLLTDFGHLDSFVGVMKGVILTINPGAVIVDLSHGVAPQNVDHGAFLLATSLDFFPRGTIFCVVVDPGVGTDRRAVMVETGDYILVGPDNGVLWEAASRSGIKKSVHVSQSRYFLSPVSATFHGRDIFAPCAAHLSLGVPVSDFGPAVADLTARPFPKPETVGNDVRLGILHTDVFGNICLNMTGREFFSRFQDGFCLEVNGYEISDIYETYGMAPENKPFLLVSSHGYLEIAVKNQDASRNLGVTDDARIMLRKP